jgi:mRNA interferase MazF
MRRGDVYLVDLNPPQGSEADKIRPAVIISNDAANRAAERAGRGVVTVIPITSNTTRVYPFQVLLPAREANLKSASKAQAEQIRAIDINRLHTRLGAIAPPLLAKLDAAVRLHLDL